MANLSEMKKELLLSVIITDANVLSKANIELDILEITDGLNGQNNLESFYSIWKDVRSGALERSEDKNDVNSWLAYALGITGIKPINDNFLPERRAFARAGFPDIDSDFVFFHQLDI